MMKGTFLLMNFDKNHALKVLQFWLQTEFFNTFDLKNMLPGGDDGFLQYTASDFKKNPNCLPWFNRQHIRLAGKSYHPHKAYSYTLYIGIFNRNEFAQQTKDYFKGLANDHSMNSQKEEDWQQRRDDGGITCCAKIKLNAQAELQLDSLEMSTAPWALGKLLKGEIDSLRKSDFDQDVADFSDKLKNIHRLASNIKHETNTSDAFTHFELFEILKFLSQWAGFKPNETCYSLIVQLNNAPREPAPESSKLITDAALKKLRKLTYLLKEDCSGVEEVVAESVEQLDSHTNENDVPILNSFFIEDIARSIKLIEKNELDTSSPLYSYLLKKPHYYADLLSKSGETIIKQKLSHNYMPLGRWPDSAKHTMSLMQQFSINTATEHIKAGGLYSVNGPPGTGKTTMLRDIIAANIVKRAKVLSRLKSSKGAFSKTKKIKIGDEASSIQVLKPALTGFEMVVVSSNNNAVENITKELPQIKALGNEFNCLTYLQSVAQKIAAHVEIKQKRLIGLEEKDDCWGMIAAALGNSGNRKCFTNKVFFDKTDKMQTDEVSKSYTTLVDGIKLLSQKGEPETLFKDSQQQYVKAERAVNKAIVDLQRLEALAELKHRLEQLSQKCLESEGSYKKCHFFASKLHQKCLPWWHYRIFKSCKIRGLYSAFCLRVEQRKRAFEALKIQVVTLESKVLAEERACKEILALHSDVMFVSANDDLDTTVRQRKAFGHSQTLNKLRSELTIAAFNLHEAWLVASYNNGLSQTLNKLPDLLQDKITKPDDAKLMWQLFFMICPVVSSAFASVTNQFSSFGQGDIGWLFIDESGQASPQLAVGALLRAKRAVVVGDPLQIEPVFTIPPDIVEFLGERLLQDDWLDWSPSLTSVQELADRVNPYGTSQIAYDKWLGSPLRVHRRCSDPMFSISNQIAYNNKMIHGLDEIAETEPFIWGPSSWFDVSGTEKSKHFVAEQAEYVLSMLYEFINREGHLPDCYIISPFSNVKKGVDKYLKKHFSHQQFSDSEFKTWLEGRVGTVHTFQGKEEKLVIFVLGATDSAGAAKWAASKPNLLNVAVTRAKKRVYIIGCYNQWAGLRYFTDAISLLESADKICADKRAFIKGQIVYDHA